MSIFDALKSLFRRQKIELLPLAISEEEAMEIARQECERRGWRWYRENMIANEYRAVGRWDVRTRGKGGGFRVSVDGTTGKVRNVGRWPR